MRHLDVDCTDDFPVLRPRPVEVWVWVQKSATVPFHDVDQPGLLTSRSLAGLVSPAANTAHLSAAFIEIIREMYVRIIVKQLPLNGCYSNNEELILSLQFVLGFVRFCVRPNSRPLPAYRTHNGRECCDVRAKLLMGFR